MTPDGDGFTVTVTVGAPRPGDVDVSIRVRSDLPAESHGKVVATLLAAVEGLTGVPCDRYAEAIMTSGGDPGVHCVHCDTVHALRYLCDPARVVLDALAAKAAARDMPTLEFLAEPLAGNPFSFGHSPHDKLLVQLVVQAAAIPIDEAGTVLQPAVVITGVDHHEQPLPQWLYAGTAESLRKAAKLFADMTQLAIRGAQRGGGKGRT